MNIGTDYHPAREPDSNWRQQICSLKLRVAHGSNFPFFIVGSEQFKDISPDLKLTVVDGIIGAVLGLKAAHSRFQQGFDPEETGWERGAFDSLDPGTQQEIIQDWVIDLETFAELRNNPVSQLAASSPMTWGRSQRASLCTSRKFPSARSSEIRISQKSSRLGLNKSRLLFP